MSTIDQTVDKAIKAYVESAALDEMSKEMETKGAYISSLVARFDQISSALEEAIWIETLIRNVFNLVPADRLSKQRERLSMLLERTMPTADAVLTLDQNTFTQLDEKSAKFQGDLSKDLDALREQFRVAKSSWIDKCTAARNVIRIPDLLTKTERTATEEAITELRDIIDKLSDRESFKSADAASQSWARGLAKFEKHSKVESFEGIKEKYGLADETVSLIQKLLQGERVSLASVDPVSLSDLYKLKQFSAQLMLNFSSNTGDV
ncbi:MAG: hypothetical protein JRN15_06535 [Nitrososphaerota archaeon]|nr:hypothetical protein [Nitrososphaerota archaeon]